MAKYQVPEAMVKALMSDVPWLGQESARVILSFAAHWLAVHPIVPSEEEARKLARAVVDEFGEAEIKGGVAVRGVISQWQAQMFLLRDEVPEAIREYMWSHTGIQACSKDDTDTHNACVLAAYEAGKRSMK